MAQVLGRAWQRENNHKRQEQDFTSCSFFAERLGFEPRVQSPVRRISSAVHSTTLASLQGFGGCSTSNYVEIGCKFKEIY